MDGAPGSDFYALELLLDPAGREQLRALGFNV